MIRRPPLTARAAPHLLPQSRLRGRCRTGTSLLEVLVGLGILAVGAISAFVLFPLSAINISRALIDDRTTTCAITGDEQLRSIHQRFVVEPETRGFTSPEPYYRTMDNPGTGPVALAESDPNPSYPVFVDPMGIAAGRGTVGNGGTRTTTFVPRVNLFQIASLPQPIDRNNLALRFCSQMDGLTFDEDGNVPAGFDMRELRYNWLWVLQRPVNSDRFTIRQQVVVFDKRAHLYAPPDSEAVYDANFTPGDTVISGVSTLAEVRKGSWVMDATIRDTVDGDGVTRSLRHAEFYRVVSATEDPTVPGTYVLEVHKPVVRPDGLLSRSNPNTYAYTGSLVLFPAAVEVYERPLLTGEVNP